MATVVIDLQFGSTGKGLISGYLSSTKSYDAVVSANAPNAGHTFVEKDGTAWIHKVLPSGIFCPETRYVMIGPGSVFDFDRLMLEVTNAQKLPHWKDVQVVIHECASLLRGDHVSKEQAGLNHISSTMQGSMEAAYEKMARGSSSNVVKHNMDLLSKFAPAIIVVSSSKWLNMMLSFDSILVEGSQGYSLGIDAGFYPYCTSRNCTADRVLSECGVPGVYERHVVGSSRVHPIRVGDTTGGTSGGYYDDQREVTWADIGQPEEYTTVTKRIRRVFTFSEQQIREALFMNGVTDVFLNFCNYDPQEAIRIRDVINEIGATMVSDEYSFGPAAKVKYMGFGPKVNDVLVV